MDRLSKWNGEKYVLPQGRWREIADRLGAYEETGLEPEEIMALTKGKEPVKKRTSEINNILKSEIIRTLNIFRDMSDKRFSEIFEAAIDAVNDYGEME